MWNCRSATNNSFPFFSFAMKTLTHLPMMIIFLVGVKALRDVGVDVVSVDPCSDPECAAESAALTSWRFQGLKSESKRKPEVEIVLHSSEEEGYVDILYRFLKIFINILPSNHSQLKLVLEESRIAFH